MIKVEKIDVWGFEHAVRGMRNPMDSWDKGDSRYLATGKRYENIEYVVGENDLDLMKRLYSAGVEHRTWARMVYVSMDITAPLYWWKEMDRYGVGKAQVSCSTMHTIHKKEFTLDDFSHDNLNGYCVVHTLEPLIHDLNDQRNLYLQSKSKTFWNNMIQLLPSSYNQKRTVCMSYEVVFKIIKERTGHKLSEWNDFVDILKGLPYVSEIMA